MAAHSGRRVTLGRISGAMGVQGWVRVESYTRPLEGILGYRRWQLERGDGWAEYALLDGKRHGAGLIAHLADAHDRALADRDEALALLGCSVAVWRYELEPLPAGEYYWVDLEGLAVATLDGVVLGEVERVFETGANDVLVVRGERERLIPFVQGPVVHEVDLEAGRISVDWDPDF